MDPLRQKLNHLPRRPGVYLMKDRQGRLLYVGKANRLDQRVRSYFGSGNSHHPKVAAMVARIHDLETIVTDSEMEALLLEMTLIKEKRPPYNIRLKDDKRFPYLKITVQEEYPKTIITRRTPADGSRYFGPFTDVGALRRTLKMVRRIFPIRSCLGNRPGRGPKYRECLDYHIHRCAAPCIDKVDGEEYGRIVDRLCRFLEGQEESVLRDLHTEMDIASEAMEFEHAGRVRDKIRGVERLMIRQKMMATQERDLDVFAIARDEGTAYGAVLQVRGGKVLGKKSRSLSGTAAESDAEVMAAFITQYYRDADTLPREVAAAPEPEGVAIIQDWLSRKAGRKVRVLHPQRGRIAGLVRLAEENARLDLEEARGEGGRGKLDPAVYELQKALDLSAPPSHIEGFDISNIQGTEPVASVVVFRNGRPHRGAYRKLKMRAPGPNDFAMMAEAVARRAARIAAGEFPLPDLILIDGGAGQVSAARTALEQEGLADVPMVGLAKREEEIVFPGGRVPLRLAHTHPGLKLLIRVRDESHRFALQFHRSRRAKALLHSELDDVPGVGQKRRLLLLDSFGSVDGVREADVDAIAAVPGIGRAVAESVVRTLGASKEGASSSAA